jgi:hypothetical protein
MASTFHDDGKTRFCYSFEDNFESRMTRTHLSWMQPHPHGAILRHLLNMVNSFLCSSTNYFDNRLLPNDLIIVRNHGDDEEDE